jgi:hypothetical protein
MPPITDTHTDNRQTGTAPLTLAAARALSCGIGLARDMPCLPCHPSSPTSQTASERRPPLSTVSLQCLRGCETLAWFSTVSKSHCVLCLDGSPHAAPALILVFARAWWRLVGFFLCGSKSTDLAWSEHGQAKHSASYTPTHHLTETSPPHICTRLPAVGRAWEQ